MLANSSSLIEGFEKTIRESIQAQGQKLEEIRQLIFICNEFRTLVGVGQEDSLLFWSFMESFRIAGSSLYMCYCGLYRNAYDNVRHLLESIVQAFYVDSNHPSANLFTKLEILKEIEDRKEYHSSRLIEEKISFKNLGSEGDICKGLLKKEYSELSKQVHPSHEKVITTVKDILTDESWMPLKIDGEEIAGIFEQMRQMFDIIFFLVVASNPKIKTVLGKNAKLTENIQKYDLKLLKEILES